MSNLNDRTIKVLGNDKVESFKNKVILVFGLGGVGGTALEALARSGFMNFIIVDFDKVDESNLNRQILYTKNDVGLDKTIAAKNKLLSINPDIKIETISTKIMIITFSAKYFFISRISPFTYNTHFIIWTNIDIFFKNII